MAQGVERFFKAAIVDKNTSISSAALVSAYHLFPSAKDVVKRWVNEAQEAVSGKSSSSILGVVIVEGILDGEVLHRVRKVVIRLFRRRVMLRSIMRLGCFIRFDRWIGWR